MAERKYPIEEYKKEVYKFFPEYDKTYIDNVLSEAHPQWNKEFYYCAGCAPKQFRNDELDFRYNEEINKDQFINVIKNILKGEFIDIRPIYDKFDAINGFTVESYDLYIPTLEEVVKDNYEEIKTILERPYDEISAMKERLKEAEERLEKLANKTQGK